MKQHANKTNTTKQEPLRTTKAPHTVQYSNKLKYTNIWQHQEKMQNHEIPTKMQTHQKAHLFSHVKIQETKTH